MHFRVEAAVGNADGVFDAAYSFGVESGGEGSMVGTADAVGAAVATYLRGLTAEDCRAMEYGSKTFFIQFVVTPEGV